jgi:hypothetical protein
LRCASWALGFFGGSLFSDLKRSRTMTLTTLFVAMGVVLFTCGAILAIIAPRHPSYEDSLQLAAGGSLIIGLCCFGIGLERVFGTAQLH